jgi:hypothetical protein
LIEVKGRITQMHCATLFQGEISFEGNWCAYQQSRAAHAAVRMTVAIEAFGSAHTSRDRHVSGSPKRRLGSAWPRQL